MTITCVIMGTRYALCIDDLRAELHQWSATVAAGSSAWPPLLSSHTHMPCTVPAAPRGWDTPTCTVVMSLMLSAHSDEGYVFTFAICTPCAEDRTLGWGICIYFCHLHHHVQKTARSDEGYVFTFVICTPCAEDRTLGWGICIYFCHLHTMCRRPHTRMRDMYLPLPSAPLCAEDRTRVKRLND